MSSYPLEIDSSVTIPIPSDNSTAVNSSVITVLRLAVLAIETELGVKPSDTYGTVTERLAAITTAGHRLNVVSVTDNYTILKTDDVISVGVLTAGKTITMPLSPTLGDRYYIKDQSGQASIRNISVNGNGKNIDGSASLYVMNTNYKSITLIYTGTEWSLFI